MSAARLIVTAVAILCSVIAVVGVLAILGCVWLSWEAAGYVEPTATKLIREQQARVLGISGMFAVALGGSAAGLAWAGADGLRRDRG